MAGIMYNDLCAPKSRLGVKHEEFTGIYRDTVDTYENSSVSDSDTDEYEKFLQVNSLNNGESQNLKEGENEKWLFDTGANVHATNFI